MYSPVGKKTGKKTLSKAKLGKLIKKEVKAELMASLNRISIDTEKRILNKIKDIRTLSWG